MGRQWLHAKREVARLKKGQLVGKLVKEIMVAAKLGGPEPAANARLAAVVDKARKASVGRDVIERAIKKGAGIGDEKNVMEHVVFEGYAPNKVPVIVEILTDNNNRTAPEIRVLFRKGGQLGSPGSNKFLFDHVGLVEGHIRSPGRTLKQRPLRPAYRMWNLFRLRRMTTFREPPEHASSLTEMISTPFHNGWPQMDGPLSPANWATGRKASLI